VAQLFLTGWITRRFSVTSGFSVLPVLLLLGGGGMIAAGGLAAGGLAAALLIKGADGSLRYSLHKTTSEMLVLAFPEAARRRLKGFIDVVGQRGGQAVASAAILGITRSRFPGLLPVLMIALAVASLL